MFSDNEKISLRQLKRLLVFDLFSVSGIIVPRIATASSGKDGLIAIILAILFAIFYAWILLSLSKCTGGNYLDYSKRSIGSYLTFIIGVLYIMKLSVCCIFAARLFGEVINETLLEDTGPRIIILLLLIVSAYAASKGFEVRARIAEILYFIVIVPIFIFLVLGLNKIKFTNLMPLFTEGTANILWGGYSVFLTFSILELIMFTGPLIKFKKSDLRQRGSVMHFVTHAIVVVGILDILLFVVTLGILGRGETGQKLWSMVNMIQVIKLPGGFIQRQDAIILGFWMLSIFTIISAFFYYISFITKFIFHIPKQNYLLIPFIILLFLASVIPIETEQFFYYFEYYMKFIGMPQSILLPVFIVFIGKVRKIKNTKPVIKTLLLLTTILSVTSLTGCSDMTEIEDRNFIQAMGIDLNDSGELTVYYVLPDLKALTEQGSENPEKLILQLNGFDYWGIEELYNLEYNKRLDFSHLKAIIIGKKLAEDQKQLTQFLTYVENKYELGRNTLVFTSDSTAKDIISLNKELEGGIGDYLDRLYRINLKNSGKEVITIGDLVYAMNEQNPVVGVPLVKAGKKTMETIGLGMYYHNQLVYEVNKEEADFIDIANGYGKNNVIFLSEYTEEDLKEENSEAVSKYVVKINNITKTLDFTKVNNKPQLTIKIEGIGIIEKGFKDTGQTSNKANANVIEEIENRCNTIIKTKIAKNIEIITKGAHVDFMNLYRMTSYKDRNLYLSYENKEDQFIKDLQYTIDVDLKIQ
ncbi:GerAB/ArcD/ProY family transporter [Anaerocolumna sp. MB42-C2]|uniref:GerAB/ArcD/ProY family transporter n=1 Tax=Anaerocolumna sp. MB42-C2 TaxID=3070997 RepID=UPI0027E171C6|nr:GerAB/ArcD/ProY family transporter [Anaerocolumna sp. MB42-C2]WMJ88109.1 GerAB/ArcD/ProY family transporter [Anaerocolumna sp. MB42-C2]